MRSPHDQIAPERNPTQSKVATTTTRAPTGTTTKPDEGHRQIETKLKGKSTMERPPITKEKCVQLGREHWSKIKGNRSYAGTPDVDTGLGAISLSWHEAGGSFASHQPDSAETFDKFLLKLSDAAPEIRLIQPRPSEPPKLPEPWVDPVTAEKLPSPFSLKDDAARLRATSALVQHDPELLAHFQSMHADPYAHVQSLREAEAKRLRQSSAKYGEAEHTGRTFSSMVQLRLRNQNLSTNIPISSRPSAVKLSQSRCRLANTKI
jgi:hypothetical protein